MDTRCTTDAPTPPDLASSASLRRCHVAVEEWFLWRGMPTVMRAPASLPRLLVRAVPLLIAYVVVFLTISGVDIVLRAIEPDVYRAFDAADTILPQWYLGALVAGVVLALVTGIVVNRIIRRRPPDDRAMRVLGVAVPIAVLLLPMLDLMSGSPGDMVSDLVGNALAIVATLVLIRSGLGAVFIWAVRKALAQGSALSSMAARALPMIVLVTLFAFLSEGMWRVSGALSRNELWLAVAILLGIAVVFIWTVIQGEMRQLMENPRCSPDEILAQGFPAEAVALAPATIARPVRLRKRETANALFILFVAQAIQVGSLVILVFVFFCVFGAITVPGSVIEVWTGHAPRAGALMGVRLPVWHELIQTSLFLAAFSAVSFAASSVNDPMYRQNFFEPILRDMRVTIAARNLYRASSLARIEEPGLAAPASEPASAPESRVEPTP